MAIRALRLSFHISYFRRPILSQIMNFKGSNLQQRSKVYTNDQSNLSSINQLKQQHNTEYLLRFADRSITYREYQFNYPNKGHGLVQELPPITPAGIWSVQDLKQLFEEQQDEVETRKVEAEFRKQTDELISEAKAMYPNKIEKKNSGDQQGRRSKDTITIDQLRKMSDEKFSIYKKNINLSYSRPQYDHKRNDYN